MLAHKGVAVVRAACLILALLVEGYAAKIVKGGCCSTAAASPISIFCFVLYVHFGFDSLYVLLIIKAFIPLEG